MAAVIALLDIGVTGKLVAGGILGLGLLWFIVKMVRDGQKAQIEKISLDNYIKQEQQNKQIQEAIKADVEDALKKVPAADPADW